MVTDAEPTPTKKGEEPRRRKLLEAAFAVFMRFGFRKTSMEEVARAADVSRQGLYLHFSTKEELFRATVQYALEASSVAALEQLEDPLLPVERRLVAAFDEWVGRYVGLVNSGVSDLAEATNTLVAPLVAEYEQRFVGQLAKYVRTCGLLAAYKPVGLTARQLADILYATARGLKHISSTRADFVHAMSLAVRAMCLPLGGARSAT